MNTSAYLIRRVAQAGLALTALAGASVLAAPAAQAKVDIAPYLEVDQAVDADLSNGGDVLTYTDVAAGVDAQVTSRRVEAQISYRYERRIGWGHKVQTEDVQNGLAQVRLQVAPNVLSLDGGAIVSRSRYDPRGAASGFTGSNGSNLATVYGAYAGPNLSTHAGPVAVSADYHLGYVKVDDGNVAGGSYAGGHLDRYDSSVTQDAKVSVGMAPGRLPFGWTAAAGWQHEKTNQLKQEFDGRYVRGDVVVPLSGTLAVTAGVGYEKIKTSQQDVKRDSSGQPVVTPGGRLVADPSKPRLASYDQSGLIWDAGVIWRPSPRTELQARFGRRYGDFSATGTLEYHFSKDMALNAVVYDSVSSFGRTLITDISGLPVKFKVQNHGLNTGWGGTGGCVFGSEAGSGGCLEDAFQSVTTADFRNRGVAVMLSGNRGPWDMSIGAGYARRNYLTPNDGTVFVLNGVVEQTAMVEASLGRRLTERSGFDLDAYAEWYDSGIAGNDNVTGAGVTGTYYRSFLDHLQGQASVGVYGTESNGTDSIVASALLGLRYQF